MAGHDYPYSLTPIPYSLTRGAVAQLVERFHGMEEVRGSSPLSSTTEKNDPHGSFLFYFALLLLSRACRTGSLDRRHTDPADDCFIVAAAPLHAPRHTVLRCGACAIHRGCD